MKKMVFLSNYELSVILGALNSLMVSDPESDISVVAAGLRERLHRIRNYRDDDRLAELIDSFLKDSELWGNMEAESIPVYSVPTDLADYIRHKEQLPPLAPDEVEEILDGGPHEP